MKRFFDISIWMWAVMGVMLVGGVWWAVAGRMTPKPSKAAVECHAVAREMLMRERGKIFARYKVDTKGRLYIKVADDAAKKAERDYETKLERLKRDEWAWWRAESAAIEKWVAEGRAINQEIQGYLSEPMNRKKQDDLVKRWGIHLEKDMVALLGG